mmetsp:Transcript_42720/g.71286  ORF Transcript_42720/g.71286 Transcript_42720/m.71286 type:complete len:288 (-) Transcript_42720:1387-2250(-)
MSGSAPSSTSSFTISRVCVLDSMTAIMSGVEPVTEALLGDAPHSTIARTASSAPTRTSWWISSPGAKARHAAVHSCVKMRVLRSSPRRPTTFSSSVFIISARLAVSCRATSTHTSHASLYLDPEPSSSSLILNSASISRFRFSLRARPTSRVSFSSLPALSAISLQCSPCLASAARLTRTAQRSGLAPTVKHSSAAGVKLSSGGYSDRIRDARSSRLPYFDTFCSCMHLKAIRSAVEAGTSQPLKWRSPSGIAWFANLGGEEGSVTRVAMGVLCSVLLLSRLRTRLS